MWITRLGYEIKIDVLCDVKKNVIHVDSIWTVRECKL